MSPLPSTAESWDSDPDLVLPDGPLTLLQSDTEAEAETSSSSVSALFSTNGNHSVYSVDEPHPSDDYKQRRSSQSSQDEESAQASRRDKQPSRANRTSLQTDEDDLDDDRKGGTLTLKSAHAPSNRNLHPADNFTSLSSQQPTQEHDRSFSSASSSECQSTIKASFLPLPNPDSQSSSNPIHHYRPQKTHSKRSTTQIDRTVLAVLASGAKGTVTRLEPSKRPSPVQAGLDWDEDIVLPEGGLKTVFRPTSHSTGDVKKQPSFASAISDELEDLNLGHHPSSSRSGIASSSHITRLNNQPTKSAIQCSTVNEEDGDFGDDFELPPSGQSINLTDPKKNSHRQSISKPNSAVSLTSSEFDGLDDDPFDPPKSSASSCRGSIFMTTLPNSSANSISQSNGNRGSIDDNTPRIRTRPSLTPSLMSDRSSSSFPEIEDDINEGFFDDIEFPPEFGVLNNLAPAPSSSTPTSTSGPAPPQPAPSTLPDPKGKQPVRARGLDLQTFLRSKLQARTLMAERANSSQFRENISTFEDRNDERVEDGLEIETGSIHTAKLRSRKSSSLSSASSHAHQSGHNSYFQQVHGQKSKSKRITVPFPSSNHSIASTSQPSERHARFSNNRSPLNQNHDDNTNRSTPLPSSSSAILPGRPTSHTSLITRPNSAIPPGTSHSRLRALIPHRPISATGMAPKSAPYSCFVNPPSTDSLPHLKGKSLRSAASHGEMSNNSPRASHHLGTDTSSRVQSPLGNPSRAARLVSRVSAASSLRARVSTMAACNGPPVLSASSQRTLKHKKSAAALKSLNLGSSGPQSNSSSPSDARPPLSSPPGSNGSSNGRGLQRKQSMPSLNSRESHYTSSSGGLPPHLGGATPSGMSAASVWKSGAVPQPKARQQPYDYSSTPSSPNLIPGSALPSYADPTRASMNRHVGASAAASGSTSGLPDRSSSVNSRRSSTESVRVNACSPAPPMTVSTPAGSSRLTMPTIASRLKAKPSIIHEEHSSNSRRWTTNGMSAVIPHQLRRPRRPRTYGDGTELDEFDDLPTISSKLGSVGPTNPNNEKKDGTNHPVAGSSSQRSRSRLEARKAEGVRRRALAINAHIKKISTKKGLIRQMSGNTLSQLSTNTEMRWNDEEARWEGNEHVLREFDNVLSTSSRPALISQLSIQSPHMRSPTGAMPEDMPESLMGSFRPTKAQNHVVGGMIFDTESMSWKKVPGGGVDEDELQLESDEELELRWLADDESSSRQKPLGGLGNDGWNSLSSSVSSPHPQHKHESEDGATRNRGRRSGSFWLACVEAEERHKKEIASWIPVDDDQPQRPPQANKPAKKVTASGSSSHQPVKLKKSNLSSNHTPSSASSTYHKTHHLNPPSTGKQVLSSNHKPASAVPPTHSHGRLSDPDRCYLQEIRKLVSEEF
ncbi:hypothetical protein PTTG_00718 [Puccinia triticina 1-1 BBBD Race 1]|uniref:Uncharacterized protein n=1 Tax=Puccinia triticina (isolate 1-1 / race 1 (BBBD)) TaxID=630390 RepID=A0A180GC13_PUCT1|nr:hypothetical protein PTTG_00718 [Puccinia triticina 1-1 BBBD Race 1]